MSRLWKFTLFPVLLLIAAFALPLEAGTLEGVVTNHKGPVENVTVEVRNIMTGAVVRATTDSNGFYRMENLRPGRYSLRANAQGHESIWIPRILVEHGTTSQDLFLHADRSRPAGI